MSLENYKLYIKSRSWIFSPSRCSSFPNDHIYCPYLFDICFGILNELSTPLSGPYRNQRCVLLIYLGHETISVNWNLLIVHLKWNRKVSSIRVGQSVSSATSRPFAPLLSLIHTTTHTVEYTPPPKAIHSPGGGMGWWGGGWLTLNELTMGMTSPWPHSSPTQPMPTVKKITSKSGWITSLAAPIQRHHTGLSLPHCCVPAY